MLKRSSRKSFKLDHSYDERCDLQLTGDPPFTITEEGHPPDDDDDDYARLMESPKDRRRRYLSIGVMNFTAFTFNLAFSIVLTSAYPYLIQMEDGVDPGKDFLGYVVAAQPLAQLFFSPIMGYLGGRLGSIRYLSMTTMSLLSAGFVFYACIHALPPPRKWYLVIARFIVGAAAGTFTLCFSYIATATTIKERTTAFSLLALFSSSAFVVGPAIQTAFAPLGPGNNIAMGSNLYFNSYTGPAWLSAAFALINLFLLSPVCFTEFNIAQKESDMIEARARKNATDNDQDAPVVKKPDLWMLIAIIYLQSVFQFTFIFIETLGTAMTTDMLGWNETTAIIVIGIAFAAAGIYNGVLYALMGFLARKVGERNLLLVAALFSLLGPVSLFPYSGAPPPLKNETIGNLTTLSSIITAVHEPWIYELSGQPIDSMEWLHSAINLTILEIPGGSELGGCPASLQPWCLTMPAIKLIQFIFGFLFIATGYPFGNAMGNAMFSKVLGPHAQGTWLGILNAGGCVSRTLSPILVSALYTQYGPRATFGFMAAVIASTIVVIGISYRRLIPYKYPSTTEVNKY